MRAGWWVASLLVSAACGRLGFGQDHAADAVTDGLEVDGPTTDAPSVLGAFEPPEPLTSLSNGKAFDADGSLTADLLEIFFVSNRLGSVDGSKDIWTSRRLATTAPWPDPTVAARLNSPVQDSAPHVSADGLTLWLASMRSGNNDVYVSTRPSRDAGWSEPAPVIEVNSDSSDSGFAVSHSGLIGYFRSDRDGNEDLYRTTRASTTSDWTTPIRVTEVSTASSEENPTPTTDDRVLYFASNRPGGTGAHDLYVATRPAAGAPFGTPVAVTELNSSEYDSDPWLSEDARVIVFSSNRNGGGQQFDLFQATR